MAENWEMIRKSDLLERLAEEQSKLKKFQEMTADIICKLESLECGDDVAKRQLENHCEKLMICNAYSDALKAVNKIIDELPSVGLLNFD